MYLRWITLFSFIVGMVGMASCGQLPMPSVSSFIPWSSSMIRKSTIARSLEPELHICLEGSMNPRDLERVKTWSRRAALTWLRAIKLIDNRILGRIIFSCEKSHLTIRLQQGGGTSYASPSVSTIYLTRPYGTWTHEFGHAFAGLSDTYAGSAAGSCRSGQPESLMCWGAYGPRANPDAWSTLWQDDIKGIHYAYAQVFGGGFQAPDWANTVDPEAPLISDRPWPGQTRLGDDDRIISSRLQLSDNIPVSSIDYENSLGSIDL